MATEKVKKQAYDRKNPKAAEQHAEAKKVKNAERGKQVWKDGEWRRE